MIICPTIKSAKKAYNDGMLSQDVYKNIQKCLKSSCSEDIIFSGSIIKQNLLENLGSNLNDEQKRIMNNLLEYLYSPMDEDIKGCLLNGSAGTGKTTTMSKVIYAVTILSPDQKICINAPTHKAIKVLEQKCSNVFDCGQISFNTTHKALGLRLVYTNDGKISFKKTSTEPSGLQLMVIDETSMLEDDLSKTILMSKAYKKTKLIFMGDIKQLPPVNTKESFIFSNTEQFKIHQMNLTQIVRQVADNPIVKYTKWLGDNMMQLQTFKLQQDITKEGDGIIIRKKEDLKRIIEYWYNLPRTKVDNDYIRILAWTNKTVNECNIMCRNILFNNPEEVFTRGERIVAREQIMSDKECIAENSDEFTVDNCNVIMMQKTVPFLNKKLNLEFYEIWTRELDVPLYVVTKNSRDLYETWLENVKSYCIRQQDKTKWVRYYNMCAWNAKINYAYANTIHTSQGSTYENAIVIMDDVDKNRNFVERNKLCYTAFTRAKKKLILIQ